tara:strand:- start:1348 stop:1722 length:375 start_codon:yes stop_codon:yes gene_type:complete
MNYYLSLTIIGVLTGLAGGIFGAGAEILIVPLLTLFNVYKDIKKSIGTSLFMLLPPIGIFAAYRFYNKGDVDVFAGLYMALLFTIFSFFSSGFTIYIDATILRKIFGIFTILAGIWILLSKNEK